MAFTPQEQQIIKFGIQNGKSQEETTQAIANYRAGVKITPSAASTDTNISTTDKPAISLLDTSADTTGDIIGTGRDIKTSFDKRKENMDQITADEKAGKIGLGDSLAKKTGELFGLGNDVIGSVFKGVVKQNLSQPDEQKVNEVVHNVADYVGNTELVKHGVELYNKLKDANPDAAKNVEEALNILSFGANFLGANATKNGITSVENAVKAASEAAKTSGTVVPTTIEGAAKTGLEEIVKSAKDSGMKVPDLVTGAGQVLKETADRIPRLADNIKTGLQDAAVRATDLKTATPAVKAAVDVKLDPRIIGTVQSADKPTLEAYKKITDLAENTGKTLRVTDRPEIIAGEAASDQYKLIDAKRKEVGAALGEKAKELSKTTKVDMIPAYQKMSEILKENGVTGIDENGKLEFNSASRFSRAQREKIQELYTEAHAGESVSPYDIYKSDQKFSQLQREARLGEANDIRVTVPGEDSEQSLFSVFRDVYSKTLDDVSPEIRGLNSQYRKYRTFVDDLESTIIKNGGYDTNKNISPSEFAQTNLRRALSDAGSAADYRNIIAQMDKEARALGYQGANAEDLIAYATEMRKLFANATPKTSLGGITTQPLEIIGKILRAGEPGVEHQQVALKKLLEEALKSK